jgi:hypothetical protein
MPVAVRDAPPPTIKYVTANLDSNDVVTADRSIDIDCCLCEGLCDDVARCQCLQTGKNYSYSGQLIPGHSSKIVECNMRCSW